MSQPSRASNGRNSAHYSRHVQQNQHAGRNSHQSRWPVTVTHVPFTKDYRQLYNSRYCSSTIYNKTELFFNRQILYCILCPFSNEKESNFDGYGKPSISGNGVSNPPNIFVTEGASELRELRQLTPPLPFAVRTAQVIYSIPSKFINLVMDIYLCKNCSGSGECIRNASCSITEFR